MKINWKRVVLYVLRVIELIITGGGWRCHDATLKLSAYENDYLDYCALHRQ